MAFKRGKEGAGKGVLRCACIALTLLWGRDVRAQSKIEALDDSWTMDLKPAPQELAEVASGVLRLDGKAYLLVVGAESADFTDEPSDGYTLMYSFSDQEWTKQAPRLAHGDHHAADVVNNKFYLFGGCDGPASSMVDVQIASLVGTEDGGVQVEWKRGTDMPFATCSASSNYLESEVYVCGGIYETETVDTCAAYNPDTNSWRLDVAPMPIGRNHAASCTDGENFFVFGGRTGKMTSGEVFDETQVFTPSDDGGKWEVLTDEPLPHARGGMGKAPIVDGRCYIIGGEIKQNAEVKPEMKVTEGRTSYAVDVFDTNTRTWSEGADMPEALHGIFPVFFDGKIYVATGAPIVGVSRSDFFLEYDPATYTSNGR